MLFHSLAMHRCVGEEEWHRGVVMNLEIFSQRVTCTLFAVLQCLSQSAGGGQLGLAFRCDDSSLLPQSTGWVEKSLPLRRMALAEGKKCINSSLQLNEGAASLHYRPVCNLLQKIIIGCFKQISLCRIWLWWSHRCTWRFVALLCNTKLIVCMETNWCDFTDEMNQFWEMRIKMSFLPLFLLMLLPV